MVLIGSSFIIETLLDGKEPGDGGGLVVWLRIVRVSQRVPYQKSNNSDGNHANAGMAHRFMRDVIWYEAWLLYAILETPA
jgi:hypothetical protein